MKAWTVDRYGPHGEVLRLDHHAPEPVRGPTQCLLGIKAVGLNFADLLSTQGRYQVKPPLPFTPGLEASGVVLEADSGAEFRVGQKVIAALPWGALAQHVAVEPASCFPVPEGMSFPEAAALFLTYQTSHFALCRRALLRAGESVLIHNGAGGVGSAAIQIAKALGARVAATAGSSEKMEVCRRAGADLVIDYRGEDFVEAVRQWTDGRGADVIYDSVGGDVFDASTKCIAFEGRLLVVGFAGGRIPTIAANRIMLKNIAVIGLNWGAYRDHHPALLREVHEEICEMHRRGTIAPVVFQTYPFAALCEALDDLQSRRSYGKLVIQVDDQGVRP